MKNQKALNFYDKLYTDNEKAFAGEPAQLVKTLCEFLPFGKILDIGAGAGRNALFLASKGYAVTATDISEVAMKRLAAHAKEKDLPLETRVFDATEQEIHEEYDAIICAFLLHLMTTEDAFTLIRKMQKHTKRGGFNLIITFTKDGDFFRGRPLTKNLYVENKAQLEAEYFNWKVVHDVERDSLAFATGVDGKSQSNRCVDFLAQKV